MKLRRRHRDPVPHPAAIAARQIVAELKAVGSDLSDRAEQLEDVAERLKEVVQEMRADGGQASDNGAAGA